MNYITSGLHGDYDLYMKIKALLKEPEDRLWILGDVLDGNSKTPQDGLRIVDDIRKSNGAVNLVLGNHEYFHTMRILQLEDEESELMWRESLEEMDISGKPLLEFMNKVNPDALFDLGEFMASCDTTEMIEIGGRKFYMCHGAPSLRSQGKRGDLTWQFNIVTEPLDVNRKYVAEIASDVRVQEFANRYNGLDIKKVFVVSGGTSASEGISMGAEDVDGIAFKGKNFCIGQAHTADNPASEFYVLAADAGGFWTIKIE